MGCGVVHRLGSDPALLWLWCRLAAIAPILPLTWELPYAASGAVKTKKKKNCGAGLIPRLGTSICPRYKKKSTINAREGVEKRELSYTAGGNVDWYNHCGEQYGGSFKN